MSTVASSQHTEPPDSGAAVAVNLGFLVDDGAGGFALSATGPATGIFIDDGVNGLAPAASGVEAGGLLRFGDNHVLRKG